MAIHSVPSTWEKTKFTDVLDVQGGTQPPKAHFKNDPEKGYIRLLQIRDFGHKPVPTYIPDTHNFKKCEKDDLLICRYGASLGRICTGMEGAYNVALAKVLKTESINTRFLKAYLESEMFQAPLALLSRSAQNGFNKEDLASFDFALPPLAEQKVIADKLDTLLTQVETTKARLERIPKILKSFRQSVLAAAVSGRLTEGWRVHSEFSLSLERYKTSLGNFRPKANGLEPIIEQGSWLSCQLGHVITVKSGDGLTAKEMTPDGSIPVYGGNGINGYHDKSNVAEPKVVIGRVGFYCGSIHLTEKNAWVTDNALIVDFPEKLLRKDFIFWLLSATNLREDSASTAQPVISGTKIYPIQIQIPPIEEQTEIVRQVEELFAFADRIEQQTQAALTRVNNLTQSILAKAFKGELTAAWRAANPDLITGENSAEALLKKIKTEREKIKSPRKNEPGTAKPPACC